MKLQNRIALVTGASRGIGRAIALSLASEGATVVVGYRTNEAQANAVVEEIVQMGGKAISLCADISQYEQVVTMVEQALAKFGALHIMINNAGIARDKLIYHMQPSDWLEVMQTNFGGVFNGTKAVLPHFIAQKEGVIVNVSSIMGERGWVGSSGYAASKSAINTFTRCCAMEMARFNIRVNAVLPGFCLTDLIEGLTAKDKGRDVLKQVPIRSFAQPEDIARVVTFLAGPDSQYMLGTLVPVDGGLGAELGLGSSHY